MDVALTRDQVRRVDRIASDEYGIAGLVLMENAGRNAAAIIRQDAETPAAAGYARKPNRVLVCCGTGNNGGDGFVIARHLVNAGLDVQISLAGEPDRLSPDAATNHRICRAMRIPITEAAAARIQPDDVVVDALLGTGFTGTVRPPLARIIDAINHADKAAVYAIDVPSGLDCDTGAPSNATVVADVTITFVATKTGFSQPQAAAYVGRVRVADIGAPAEIVARVLAS